MSTTADAHIAYELIEDTNPAVVAIEFLSRDLADPIHARQLGEQLDSLVWSDLPRNFVLDFKNVRSLGSTAFGEIAGFIRKAGQVRVCNMHETLRLGATLIGLSDSAEFALSRPEAIHAAQQAAEEGEYDTTESPILSWAQEKTSSAPKPDFNPPAPTASGRTVNAESENLDSRFPTKSAGSSR
jgi:anti-anti-sigma regulatory factor